MVITVVSRASTVEELIGEVGQLLYGGFKILAWYSLGQPGIDRKDRFLILIGAEDETEYDFETQEARLQSPERGVKEFDSIKEALEYAVENYELEQNRVDSYEEFEQLTESFPQLNTEEIEQFQIFDSLIRTGRVNAVPARLEGERAIALVLATHGPDELRVTPLAILATDNIVASLELPGE